MSEKTNSFDFFRAGVPSAQPEVRLSEPKTKRKTKFFPISAFLNCHCSGTIYSPQWYSIFSAVEFLYHRSGTSVSAQWNFCPTALVRLYQRGAKILVLCHDVPKTRLAAVMSASLVAVVSRECESEGWGHQNPPPGPPNPLRTAAT